MRAPDPVTIPVTVVIPAFNRAGLLPRAVASIRRQWDVQPAEVIVVDDCSTDDTVPVAAQLGVRVIQLPSNQGPSAARNAGFEAATTPWIAQLDSDDEWTEWCLASLWNERGDAVLVTGATLTMDDAGNLRSLNGTRAGVPQQLRCSDLLWPANIVASSGVLLRAEAIRAVGGYDTHLRYAEDLDLWIRLIEHGEALALPVPAVRYHAHSGQAVADLDAAQRGAEAVSSRYAGRPWWDERHHRRLLGVAGWDRLRAALRAREAARAVSEALRIAVDPQRIVGVVGLLHWRAKCRRAALAFSAKPPRRSI